MYVLIFIDHNYVLVRLNIIIFFSKASLGLFSMLSLFFMLKKFLQICVYIKNDFIENLAHKKEYIM